MLGKRVVAAIIDIVILAVVFFLMSAVFGDAESDTLVEAQTASVANDTIFVYFGTGTTNGQNAGIVLKNGQSLLGEFEGLSLPVNLNANGAPTVLVPVPTATACGGAPCRPLIGNSGAGSNVVAATDVIPAVIGGFRIDPPGGASNAIDVTTNVAFVGTGTLDIRNNIVTPAAAACSTSC